MRGPRRPDQTIGASASDRIVSRPLSPRFRAPAAEPSTRTDSTSMASTADIKNGVVIKIDGQLWSVVEFQHVKPGKGGAFVRTKLKNVVTGKTVDKTYNAGTKIEIENVDRRDFTYLYTDGDSFVFMDQETYD